MSVPSSSVLIPSFRRPDHLAAALRSLSNQQTLPDEVIVVWQGDDTGTRDVAEGFLVTFPCRLLVLHNPETGVVPAENLALEYASGEVVLLMDDDVIAPSDWVARHLAHYTDPSVGAVGGSAINIRPDGTRLPERAAEPVGKLTWYGRSRGNMYDHIPEWRLRPAREVDHLVGYNLSLRRAAFDRFESGLKRYWQMFEMDACLQVKARGYRVLFDFANVVEHYPTNTAYVAGRGGDLTVKLDNSAYNYAYVLSKHTTGPLRLVRLGYLLGIGTVMVPGLVTLPIAWRRHGNLGMEFSVLLRAWRNHLQGWRSGYKAK